MPKRSRPQRSVAPRKKAKLDQPHDTLDATSSQPSPAPRQLRKRKATEDAQNDQDGESPKRAKIDDETSGDEVPDLVPTSRHPNIHWPIKRYTGPKPPGSPNPLRREFLRSYLVASGLREASQPQPQPMERGPLLSPGFSDQDTSESDASDTTERLSAIADAHIYATYDELRRRRNALEAAARMSQSSQLHDTPGVRDSIELHESSQASSPSDASTVRASVELKEEESSQDSHSFDASKARDSLEPLLQARASVEIQEEESSRNSHLFNASRVRDPIELRDDISQDSHPFDASMIRATMEMRGDSDETASDSDASDASDATTCSNDTIQKLHAQAKIAKTHARHDEASARASEARAQTAEARVRRAEASARNDRAEARKDRMIAEYSAAQARKARDEYYRAKYSASRIRQYVESLEESSRVSQSPGRGRTQSSPRGKRSRESSAESSLEKQAGRHTNDKKKNNRQRKSPDQKISPAVETTPRSRRSSRRSATSELWCLGDHNKAYKAR